VILIPAVVGLLVGFLVSFAFTARYTSQSIVLVEEQKVPEAYVKPATTDDAMQHVAIIEQKALARNRLRPIVERLGLAKRGRSLDDVI
jgi:hypothetical protein